MVQAFLVACPTGQSDHSFSGISPRTKTKTSTAGVADQFIGNWKMQEEMTTLYHLRDAQVVLHRLIPHVRFRVPFLELESQLKSGFACTGRPCCVILQSHFLVPPDGAKNGTTQTFLHAEFIYTKTLLHTVSRQFLHTETYTHTQFF